MIKRKYIISCLLFYTFITDLIHTSGFEAQIPQAAQAIVAGVAVAVGVATKIIRPVDPQKDLPEIIIQEQPQSILQEPISEQASQLYKQSILDALSKPDASYKQIPQKSTLQNIVLKQAQPTPIPSPPVQIQPQQVLLPKVSATKAALHAAQKLQPQKQIVEIQHVKEPVKAIQQNIPAPQKQISQQSSNLPQQTPVSFEWESFDDLEDEKPLCSFTQLHAKKRSTPSDYTQKLLYERSVHFYFDRIKNSSLLKIDPVYQQLIISRKSPAHFSVMDKESLLLRHESLIHGLHEAHQEIMLLQEQDGQSSNQTPEQQNKNTQPPFDPKDPKDKKNTLLESSEKITASIFELLKKKFPQFFRDGYGFWNKVKIASVSPAMQKVAEFLNIEKDELDIHIRHIFEPAIKVIQNTNLRINGFHHDCKNLLENSGMFKFVNKEMFVHGYYKATVEIAGKCPTQPVSKSFFPAHWSLEQVMQEIHYAIRNMELVIESKKNDFDVIYNIPEYLHTLESIFKGLTFIGYTTNNMPIRIVFNPALNAFITFYPILGK